MSTAQDAAWWTGYTLGIDWIDASPSDAWPHGERLAFVAGWDTGRCEAERERDEAFTSVHDLAPREWEEPEMAECFGMYATSLGGSNAHR